jgi:hypothetical protein
MFATPRTPNDWLLYHQHWRNVGTILVIIGVIGEILIDIWWDTPSLPLLRGKKPTTPLATNSERHKRYVMLLFGIGMVAGGIALELWQGGKADDVADQIQTELQGQVIDAEEAASVSYRRAADAENEEAVLERLISPRQLLVNATDLEDLRKLTAFSGTRFWTQAIGFNPAGGNSSDDFAKVEEAERFASDFDVLHNCCGWEAHPILPTPILGGPDMEGVHIYSRRAEPYEPWTDSDAKWPNPYAMPLDTPERKSWAAAEALKQYLESNLKLAGVRHLVTDDIHGNLSPEFANLDSEAVVIKVGTQTSTEDIQEQLIDRDFGRRSSTLP